MNYGCFGLKKKTFVGLLGKFWGYLIEFIFDIRIWDDAYLRTI